MCIFENKVSSAIYAYFLRMPYLFHFLSEIFATKSHTHVPDLTTMVSILYINIVTHQCCRSKTPPK